MKKTSLLIALLLVFSASIVAQGCLPDGILLSTQQQVDEFQINYPGCTQIEGDLQISGGDITNLDGLDVISKIDGNLKIQYCPTLSDLGGLSGLTDIGGGLLVQDSDMLSNLNGFEALATIGDYLAIASCNEIIDITGLANLSAVGGNLNISGNISLKSLSGLENITANSIQKLIIQWNDSLSECEVFSICEFLINPNDTIIIQSNAPGCNNPDEVIASCNAVSIQEQADKDMLTVNPNPVSTKFAIKYVLKKSSPVLLQIIDLQGQVIKTLIDENQDAGKHLAVIDASGIEKGIYFCLIESANGVQAKKVIKI